MRKGLGDKDVLASPRVTSRKSGSTSEVPEYLKADYQESTRESIELFNASAAGSVTGVRTAIAKGGKVNYFYRPEDQKNSLHVAAEQGYKAIVELLLENDAVVECKVPSTKDTPLLLACQNGHVDIARILLKRGADVNAQNCYGNTSAHEAARKGDLELCKLLVSEGAIVDVTNNKRSTPLHFFVYSESSSVEVARLLIDSGCPVDSPDAEGRTPFLLAAVTGKVNLLTMFEDEGARVDAVDSLGHDGLELATFNKNKDAERFFQARTSRK